MPFRSSPQQQQVLEALLDHPFLTARLLAWHLRKSENAIQRLLWLLHRARLVRRYPFVPDREQTVQWLYTLTTQGLEMLASKGKPPQSVYRQKYGYSISRLRWLAAVLERVYYTREVLRFVQANSNGWWVSRWNSETEIRYEHDHGWRWLTFQCSALLDNKDKSWVPLIIEWDSGNLPIEAEYARWKNLIQAQDDAQFDYSTAYHFPVLIYVAQNRERLDQFVALIDKVRVESHFLSTPLGYLTWQSKFLTADQSSMLNSPSLSNNAPIWFDTEHGQWVTHALANCAGNPDKPWVFWKTRPLRKSFASKTIEIEPLNKSTVPRSTFSDMASLALALHPLEKKLVRAIGSHPLLTASELAFVLEGTRSKVWQGVERLSDWQLIKSHPCRAPKQNSKRRDKVRAYTLSDLGLVYLATAAGLGATPKRIALAQGWEKGFDALVYHTEHTRLGNELFLQLLQFARAHDYVMTWFSEQEARLYLNFSNEEWSGPFQSVRVSPPGNHRESTKREENAGEYEGASTTVGSYSNRKEFMQKLARHGTHYQRFLPDGRAVLQIDNQEWHIAVEIDLTRANYKKMIAKLDYYHKWLEYRRDNPNLLILLVTHHWQRANNLCWLAWKKATTAMNRQCRETLHIEDRPWSEALAIAEQRAPRELQQAILPIYITTKDDLRRYGMDQPIWIRVKEPLGQDGRVTHTFTKTRCLENIEESVSDEVA